ncbi:MAG: type IV pilus assembly protein PilM [bacterium]
MKLPEFFGLDIGNHTIKVCQTRWEGDTPVLVALGSYETPFGVTGSENTEHKKQLAENIKKAVIASGIKTKSVVVALPEGAIFTRLVPGFPKVSDDKLAEAILYEAKKYIPIPPEETNIDHMVVGERTQNGKVLIDVLIVAAPKSLVERYMEILKLSGLEGLALETEAIATTRSISSQKNFDKTKAAIVLDFGANGTDLSVIKGESLLFSQSLGTGSDAFTRAIAVDFGLTTPQAEQYKRVYGLDETKADGKIAKSLYPIIQIIAIEITKTMDFFKTRFVNMVPQKIYIVGDGGKLPGLAKYLSKIYNIDCELAKPFQDFKIDDKLKKDMAQLSDVGFTVSTGLALKKE